MQIILYYIKYNLYKLYIILYLYKFRQVSNIFYEILFKIKFSFLKYDIALFVDYVENNIHVLHYTR